MRDATVTALGIDVGGTKIAARVVCFPEARVRLRRASPIAPVRGGAAVLDDVVRLAEDLAAELGLSQPRIEGVGVGLCELVPVRRRGWDRGCCRLSGNVGDTSAPMSRPTQQIDPQQGARFTGDANNESF